ncbi:MAG: glycoside hydrolase family 3 C-terminal domain-containing protein [Lachnospiraceae bacterium]|nr:glycoside hydrolase family 3 C-terminal domain-containing protein [Lachnospiraceae bacterium]
MTQEKLKEIIAQMTLEEKAGICSGDDFWHTKSVERLGVPRSMVSDGPHGLRKQDLKADHLGVNESIKAVCFPAGCGTAASFNRDLMRKMGETLGNECQAEGVSVLLGPAVNIKRSHLCGRNFEYYSEDPVVATEIATAYIEGVQSKNVGTSIKHFLANNQETRRLTVSAEIDERTIREIYLAAFEGAIRNAKPWTVMCSYNRLNGLHLSENKTYLTDVLRGEWGYEGYVVSDWGAVNERVQGLAAGLDLEMPSANGVNDRLIVEAVQNGTLDEAVVDEAVRRILNIVYRYEENRDHNAVFDRDADHAMARKVAEETVVLLKNDSILPLAEGDEIAFIGKFASKPRYQGGGSSHINSHKVVSALEAAEGMSNITYAQGYIDEEDRIDEALLAEAIEAAKKAKAAVIFAGLPDAFESEGFDREHMRMPECQNELIRRVTEVQPNTVVVLHNGSPVEMPWADSVKGIIEAYLGGQAIGEVVCDILFGKVNPSGKLAETFPIKLEDNPSYLTGFGEKDCVKYTEGIFVGYRYYDKKNMDVLFPFGHGLSYTTFAYTNLKLDKTTMADTDTLTVSVDVTNTGKVAGKEAVQLYVSDKESTVLRPVKELKDFAKVELAPGETKTVTFTLGKRAFAYYNTELNDWHVETGDFDIMIGKSSRDIVLTETVTVTSTVRIPVVYTLNSLVGDILEDEHAKVYFENIFQQYNEMKAAEAEAAGTSAGAEAITEDMEAAMFQNMPLRGFISFSDGKVTREMLLQILEQLNAK